MTPKTLTKERREKLDLLFIAEGIYPTSKDDREALISKVIEAVQSRTEVLGIESAIFAGRPVTESDLPIGDEALKAFERDMQCPGSWSWYPAKSSDEPAWKSLREFVVKTYQSDKDAFTKYHTWAAQPYSRGAKTVGQIRQDPTCFEFAFADYLTANPVVANTGEKTEYFKPKEGDYVPAPTRQSSR